LPLTKKTTWENLLAKYGNVSSAFALIGITFGLSACGGGGSSGSNPLTPPLTLSPSSVNLDANTATPFTASGGRPPYVFSVSSGAGTISNSGVFSAPDTSGTAVVMVNDAVGSAARSTVTVNSPLILTPTAVAVGINTRQQFTANGGAPPYSFAIASGNGTIDAKSGTYQAPTSTGTATVSVTDSLGNAVSTAVTVNSTLSLLPTSITMTSGSGQTYAFTGQAGALGYQYSIVSGPGSIDASGLYSVGIQSGTTVVQVTDGQGMSATATVRSLHVRTNGPVYAAVTDGSNWYLGGTFSAVTPYQASRLEVVDPQSGAPTLSCDVADGFDDEVLTELYANGMLFVGGYFTHYRGISVPGGLVAIDATTCRLISTYFLPTDLAGSVSALAIRGSSLYVAGNFQQYRGLPAVQGAARLVKVDIGTGALDPNFDQSISFNDVVKKLLVTSTALYAAGQFTSPIGSQVVGGGLAKFDPTTGALDTAFNPLGGNQIFGPVLAIQLDGDSLFIGGLFSSSNANNYGELIKVNAATGAFDVVFNSGFSDRVQEMALSGSSLYVAGNFDSYRNQSVQHIAKISTVDGSPDPLFGGTTGFDGNANAVLLVGNALYAAGDFTHYQGQPAVRIAKLDATNGAPDAVFTQATGFEASVSGLAASASEIYASGIFRSYRGKPVSNVAKLTIQGVLDNNFSIPNGFNGKVTALALVGSSIYATGTFTSYDSLPANYLAKLSSTDGTLDQQFTQTTGFNFPVSAMTTNASALYAAGYFTSYRGVACSCIAKIDLSTGTLDLAFAQASALANGSYASALAANGAYLYIGEGSATYGGVTTYVGRVNAITGANDPAFVNDTAYNGTSTYAFSSSAVYLADMYGTPSIMKYDINSGVPYPTFVPQQALPTQPIHSMVVANSALYVAGFSNGAPAFDKTPVKLNLDTGAEDPAFSQLYATNGETFVIAAAGPNIFLGGEFTSYRGAPSYFFIPIDSNTGASLDP
jgi:hypothetical protein